MTDPFTNSAPSNINTSSGSGTSLNNETLKKKNDTGLGFVMDKRDVVGLICKAWKASFSREETNKWAILNRGWEPKALNYNALTHPEILAFKPGYNKESAVNTLKTEVDPEDLNLSDGLAAMLVEKIVLHKNKEGTHSESNAAHQQKKCKATAKENL